MTDRGVDERSDPRQDEKLEGRYANYFKVGHNAFEFVLDFGQFFSESGEERIHTRIVIGPNYARSLQAILKKSIDEHRKNYEPRSCKGKKKGRRREEQTSEE